MTIIQYLICIYILTFFFPHLTAIQEISFYGSLILSLGFFLLTQPKVILNTPLSAPLLLFLVWAVLCLPFALNFRNSAHDIYAHLIKYVLFLLLVVNFFPRARDLSRLFWIFFTATALFCIGGIFYFYHFEAHRVYERFFLVPGSFIPYLEYFLEIGFLFGLTLFNTSSKKTEKLIISLCLLSIFSAILLTQTRSALIVLVFFFVVFLLRSRKRLMWVGLVLIAAALAYLPIKSRMLDKDAFLHNERFGTARMYAEIIKDYPVTGIGFGMQTFQQEGFLQGYYTRIQPENRAKMIIASPHNVFIDTAVRTGIPGLILFLFLIHRIILSCIRMSKIELPFVKDWSYFIMAGFAGFFIQAMFSDATFGRAAITFYLLCAILTILSGMGRIEDEVAAKTDL